MVMLEVLDQVLHAILVGTTQAASGFGQLTSWLVLCKRRPVLLDDQLQQPQSGLQSMEKGEVLWAEVRIPQQALFDLPVHRCGHGDVRNLPRLARMGFNMSSKGAPIMKAMRASLTRGQAFSGVKLQIQRHCALEGPAMHLGAMSTKVWK